MGNVGLFLPYLVGFSVAIVIILGLIDRWTEPKSSYRRWLERELRKDLNYINWLKHANNGKDYKLGLKVLKKIKRGGEKK